MIRKTVAMGVLVGVAMLAGCASVPTASVERDAQAKSFSVKPDKASVYVYRNESMGGAVKMAVEVDGQKIGETAAKTYMMLDVAPGKHKLVSKSENDSVLELQAEAGKNYFVWQEVKMGVLYARSKLQLVDDATGRAGVGECSMIDIAR